MAVAILRKWAGYETPFVTRPSSSGRLLLVEACDGWYTGSVMADQLSVTSQCVTSLESLYSMHG